MVNTTLTNENTATTVILQDLDKSFISENTARKEAILTPMPLYLNDSDDTDVFDFGGCIKTITFSGVYVDTSQANVKVWVDSVEDFIQGHQDTDAGYPLKLTDDLRGALKVKVMDFESTQVAGEVVSCTWTLKLVESSENA